MDRRHRCIPIRAVRREVFPEGPGAEGRRHDGGTTAVEWGEEGGEEPVDVEEGHY